MATAPPNQRRVTRSQSRDIDNVVPGTSAMSTGLSFGRNLPSLPEVPFTSSPRNPTPRGREVVPESPENHEGHTNVSGTTLGPSDLEPNNAHIANNIAGQLPHVEKEANDVLGLIIPQNLKPRILAEEAKRLADSNTPNGKRLRRFVHGMKDELSDMTLVRQDRTFLDISDFRQHLSSAQFESVLPSLHLANCAQLALNMFLPSLPSLGTNDKLQVIQELDIQFPACFMERFADTTTVGTIGATELQQETFDLALSIRTQFFIMELERHRESRDFDPIAILRRIFCMDLIPGAEDNQEPPTTFRGFNLPGVLQDEDGHLPEIDKLEEAVDERFDDLRHGIFKYGVDHPKRVYELRVFERDLARWIQGRDKEIKEDLKRLSDDQATRASSRRLTTASVGPANLLQGSVLPTPQKGRLLEPRTQQSPQQTRSPQRVRTVEPALVVPHQSEIQVPQPRATPSPSPQVARTQAQATRLESPLLVVQEPDVQASQPRTTPQKLFVPAARPQTQPTTTAPERRKSKSHYRNSSAMAALKNRMDNSRQQDLAALESQAPNRSLNAGTAIHKDPPGPFTLDQETPEREIQQSPDLTYPGLADDTTLHNNEEELDLSREHESGFMASTSPSASARINRVSHNPGRFFDSPDDEITQRTATQRPPAKKSFPAGPRFIDAQESRAQVSPISSSYGLSAERERPERPAPREANQKKRARRLSYSSDLSDDDAFEDDNRDVDRRAEKPEQNLPAAKRQRTEAGTGLGSAAEQLQSSLDRTTQSQAEVVSSNASQADSTAERFTDSRWKANMKRDVAKSTTRKANTKWTEEENARLLELMAIFGSSYSKILKEDGVCPASDGGPKLQGRSQVSLKDGARNLRRRYEREGRVLPPGLERASK
ncbi:hypothetical protein PENANT_c017G00349 [Penicillium antarcticum]|uniref:Myb-like domain-containing protein n=1 Tax=Penicillium antarcticum TaxID=416450 RepID=A0A1V6Q1Y8_9EURO|nr:uncharacterized protein N7508_005338 [Penicillium antarcticum]KAJ5306323.1 hypothetical protein N7508_005338 [Penicillium antarcticum]OQD83235.1 hypothetical protein PENANT_c017G00349 [Penicillium antarcticum]